MIWEYKLECNKYFRFWGRGIRVGAEVGEVFVLDILFIHLFIYFMFLWNKTPVISKMQSGVGLTT